MDKKYYEETIKTYNELDFESDDEDRFLNWENMLIPYLPKGSSILDLGCGFQVIIMTQANSND